MTSQAERRAPFLVALVVLVTACGFEAGGTLPDSTTPPSASEPAQSVTCVEPPAAEISRISVMQLVAESNPVTAGAELYLVIEAPADTRDLVIGAAAVWQCWDGATWVDTHQLLRDFGAGDPATIELTPGATTTVPAIGLPVPNRHRVIVPDVTPGTYRIVDSVLTADGDGIPGFTIIEVTG